MYNVKKETWKLGVVQGVLILMVVVLFVMPLMVFLGHLNLDSIQKTIGSPIFGSAVGNSIRVASVGTIITVVLAMIMAMCVERTNIKYKGFFCTLFTISMLVPSISHGMGLIILFGNNGILTKLLGFDSNIYGFNGIVIGSVFYAFPVAFLLLKDVFHYEDGLPYEAARVLGISRWQQFWNITLPYLKKPLITVIFSTFTLIITDYGVPLMIGGKYSTIPVVMYQDVIGQLDFEKGAVYGVLLLLPAFVAFIIDLKNKNRGNSTFVKIPYPITESKGKTILSYIICLLCGGSVLLPIAAFMILAFSKSYPNDMTFVITNVVETFSLGADQYLVNSVCIALGVAVIGTVIAFIGAYMAAREKTKISKGIHLFFMTSAAVPGIVLGLAYVLFFKSTWIYGTIIILIIINMMHFIASPYIMIYNALCKINENLEAVAQTLFLKKRHIIKDIMIPMCKSSFFEMFTYFFVNCMITISAVSFLADTSNKPISLMINQFEAHTQLEYAAVVSLVILVVNIMIKGTSSVFNMYCKKGMQ